MDTFMPYLIVKSKLWKLVFSDVIGDVICDGQPNKNKGKMCIFNFCSFLLLLSRFKEFLSKWTEVLIFLCMSLVYPDPRSRIFSECGSASLIYLKGTVKGFFLKVKG